MLVSVITVKLFAPWAHSLKEKRMIVKSLCGRLHNQFNVSVIESDAQDIHRTIVISIAFAAENSAFADGVSEKIIRFIESATDAQVVDIQIENR